MSNKVKRNSEEQSLEVVLIKNGKEECRYKPESFVGCMIKNELEDEKTVKTSTIIFGKKPEILMTLQVLLEGLIEKMGEQEVLSVLQNVMQDYLKDFMADMKLEKHAQELKIKDELIN